MNPLASSVLGRVQNPWLSLPETPPFVLPGDKQIILDFNHKVKPQHRMHLNILPEPYTGNPEAKIILLNLNPGFYESNARFLTGDAYFQKTSRANLAHACQEYPFYLLDPRNSRSPGYDWYRKKSDALSTIVVQRKSLKKSMPSSEQLELRIK